MSDLSNSLVSTRRTRRTNRMDDLGQFLNGVQEATNRVQDLESSLRKSKGNQSGWLVDSTSKETKKGEKSFIAKPSTHPLCPEFPIGTMAL